MECGTKLIHSRTKPWQSPAALWGGVTCERMMDGTGVESTCFTEHGGRAARKDAAKLRCVWCHTHGNVRFVLRTHAIPGQTGYTQHVVTPSEACSTTAWPREPGAQTAT